MSFQTIRAGLGPLGVVALVITSGHALGPSCSSDASNGDCSEGPKMMQKLVKSATAEMSQGDEDCQVDNCPGCAVHTLTVAGVARCFTMYTPTSAAIPENGWPVMVYFHGMGGQAKNTCSTQKPFGKDDHITNPEYAEQLGFALLCADSDENWQFPTVSGTITSKGKSQGEAKNDDPGVGGDNKRACSASDTPDADYVEGLLDMIKVNTEYDSSKIYFMGFSQGAMMTSWASTCFANRIRGAVQAGSGLKVQGDGNNIPGGACETQCDGCEFFPIQPGSAEDPLTNVVGDELKWCQYAGCTDYLLGSILSMDEYLNTINAPHEVQYYNAAHEAPDNWFPMIAKCHGWANAPSNAGSEDHWLATCDGVDGFKSVTPIVDGSGCDPDSGDGNTDGAGNKNDDTKKGARQCTGNQKKLCCGDGICGGPENEDNCPKDCS